MLKDNATVKINYKNKIDGFKLLEQINDVSVKTIFFDPEYRGILDKMSYGNEGKSRSYGIKKRKNKAKLRKCFYKHY